jgi:hypothetical protein
MCRLSRNLGASTSSNPQGLSRPVMGLLYLFLSAILTGVSCLCVLPPNKFRHVSLNWPRPLPSKSLPYPIITLCYPHHSNGTTNEVMRRADPLSKELYQMSTKKIYKLVHQLTYALHKIHSEASIKLLHVSTPGCHHQGVIQNNGTTRTTASLGTVSLFLKQLKYQNSKI